MSDVLERAIEAIRALPPERQEKLAAFLLDILQDEGDDAEYELTPEQLEDLEIGIAQADRGEFATDEEVAAMWKRFGL